MFVDTFIRRPILASVCSLVLILAGAVAIPTMPVAQYPSLAPPQVNVTAIYTGANAQEVETAVTTPLEQAINGVEGMLYMTSSSTNSGISTITVTFDVTRDQDVAAVDVQNRVNQTLGRMPAEVRTTGITVQKQSTGFVMAVGVFSEKGDYDSLFLSNYLDVYVKDARQARAGRRRRRHLRRAQVLDAAVARPRPPRGARTDRRRRRPARCASRTCRSPPAASDRRRRPPGQMYQLSVRAVGRLTRSRPSSTTSSSRAGTDGSLVRLAGRRPRRARRRNLRRRPALPGHRGGRLRRHPAADRQLARRRAGGQRRAGSAGGIVPARACATRWRSTPPTSSKRRSRKCCKTLVEAIALVVLVIFVFLQTWRSTLIPAITIPVSLIGAFAFVKVMGFSINTLTLFGIILATGIVVDDAIVVIENIERHIQEYKVSARKAASDAMREVLGAVIATGLVLIAVFVPVAFFPGTTGRLYAQFSITIAFAVALSVFNAITLTPALSALLLDRARAISKGRFFALLRAGDRRRARAATSRVLRAALRLRWAVVLRVRRCRSAPPRGSTARCRRRSSRKRIRATSSSRSRRRPARRSSTRATSRGRPSDHPARIPT